MLPALPQALGSGYAGLGRAKQAQLFDEAHNRRFYASLRHPGISNQLAKCILDKSLNVVARRMALEIAGECQLLELSGNLLEVVQDGEETHHIRERAARALIDVLPDERLSELVPLLGRAGEPDPDDSIRGIVLQRLVPRVWGVAQALPAIHYPRNPGTFGSYQMLLKCHLPRYLTESDLPRVLARLIRWTHCFDPVNPFDELADAAFGEALQRLGSPSIRRVATRVWLVKQKRNHPLPHGKDCKVRTLLDQREDIRRSFLEAILNDAKTRTSDVGHLNGAFVQLVLPADLHWLLDQIVAVAPDRRPAWAEAVAMAACAEATVGCWDLFLERLDTMPELKARFEWLRAWSVDEPQARRAKAHWLKQQRWKKRLAKRQERPNIEELVKQDLDCIAAGQTVRWIHLCYHLAMNKGDSHVMPQWQHDLTEFPGWKRATPERQQRIVTAARQFLLKHSDGYAELGSRTNYSDPGYLAVWLLRDTVQTDAELSTAIAANWIGALVGYCNDGTGHYQVTAALAYELNSKATLQEFERRVKEDDERHGQTHCQHGFEKVWDEGFTTAALKLVGSGTLKAGSIEAILGFVATVARTEAAGCARSQISTFAAAGNSPRDQMIAVLSTSLWKMPAETWCDIWPVLDADTGLTEAVILRVADRIGYTREENMLSALSERRLADFYLKVRTLFPPCTDPKPGAEFGLMSSRMCVTDLRGKLVTALEARGTESACVELLRLANTIPEESIWLRWCYYGARANKRRKAWVSPIPQIVLGLVARGEARLVQTVADLQEVVLESLGRLQVHLTRRTLPRVEDLRPLKKAV